MSLHAISPTDSEDLREDYRLLARAREAALAALRVYNDPSAGFRTETFIVLMVIAWNALLQGILERLGLDYFELPRRRQGPSGTSIVATGVSSPQLRTATPPTPPRPTSTTWSALSESPGS